MFAYMEDLISLVTLLIPLSGFYFSVFDPSFTMNLSSIKEQWAAPEQCPGSD